MDVRHVELQDLLSQALIALEARDWPGATAAVTKALAWVEADWLATPSDVLLARHTPAPVDDADDDE